MTMQHIGRFEVINELGEGGQGVVFLANDPQLERQVAIKTLRKSHQDTESLFNEARLVSKLQHPNIIPLFDMGKQQDIPYLVYAYIEGQTLAEYLKEKRKLPVLQAAEIASGVLDALVCAHEQDVVHLDIKPANVMLAANLVPMVMDFGLARWASDSGQPKDITLSGTPRYIAPELIDGKPGTFASDIYAVGTLLYEMVTGKFAVSGEGLFEVLNRAAHENIQAPSVENEKIDERLEAIILKAVAKLPEQRYYSALDMKLALQNYITFHTRSNEAYGTESNSTLDFLVRRMRSKQDFPTISDSISEINRIVSSDTSSNSRLTSVILQDFSLTNKLLKMVNAAVYGQFGGSVNTVSKAVTILGFEAVRSIAASLIFIDFLQNKSQASLLKDELTQAVLASVVAAQFAKERDVRDVEEIMLCAMFHSLGKLLVFYYFFEEAQQILHLIEQGESEERASKKVLGISFHELGIGVARIWHFSPRLIAAMSHLTSVRKPDNEVDKMIVVVNLANELCESARYGEVERKPQMMEKLVKRYGSAVSVSGRILSSALDSALNEFSKRSSMLAIKIGNTPLLEKIRTWNGKVTDSGSDERDEQSETGRLELTLKSRDEEIKAYLRTAESELTLGQGIQDVTNSLINDFVLNDVLQMILETIYRGMKFQRAVLLTRDNRLNAMVARYGLGAQVENVIPYFRFSLNYLPDVFHLAISKGVDIAIADTQAQNIADKIPDWYKNSINAPSFLLLPAMVKDKTMCIFYADMKEPNKLNTSQQQLTLLRTLRNQAVLAIKQKV